ncbi:Sulfite oxidase [Acidisarcina polymorpha]|uniref:Sulfite oxidase n=1 Tax=Acidisarcina polymorpha TaxID=2211140 RepID=A0A2Z5FRX9_9BACT|nr:molybdopterin-dependent oxidoreductase [Acidisarcina polymorpha]AXC09468.1 Sulfite oxidase [Acidisarcina polymorpha]
MADEQIKKDAQPAAEAAADQPVGPVIEPATQEDLDREVKRLSANRTRRSFLVAGIAAAGGYGLYRWIDKSDEIGRQPLPFRKAFQFNAAVARGVFHEGVLAPTYPKGRAAYDLRLNGDYGLKSDLVPESWRLQLVGVENAHKYPQFADDVTRWQYQYFAEEDSAPQPAANDVKGRPQMMMTVKVHQRGSEEAGPSASDLAPGTPGLLLAMNDLWKLPHVEFVTEFKCIEGWSEIVSWGGVRLRDLIAAYPPAKHPDGSLPRYVYMETPDGDYYCGYDMQAAMHPQSLLVYQMGGRPITRWHGAPLRLHMPIKYGYKQIKRIGLIAYTDQKPDDYWTKLGYDWYAGL